MDVDTSRWTGLELVSQMVEGNRNEVWRGTHQGIDVSIRRSRRSHESLAWELDLLAELEQLNFRVPTVVEATDGDRHVDGVVVQRWLHGRPPSSHDDWHLVAETLQLLHRSLPGYPQRPGCLAVTDLDHSSASVDAEMAKVPHDVATIALDAFAALPEMPLVVIHGDPTPSNIRIDEHGTVGLLDFDESRVDVAWHDVSNLGVQVLSDADHAQALVLSDAWETVNAWVAEPDYAQSRLASLRSSH